MKYIRRICCGFLIFLAANIPLLKYLLISKDIIIPKFGGIILMLLLVVGVIVINIVPALSNRRIPGKSIRRSRRRSCRSIFPTTRKKRIPPIIRIRERSR